MKRQFFFAALLISAPVANAEGGNNYDLFQQHMRSYLADQGVDVPVSFTLGVTDNNHVYAQLDCEGIADDVACVETVDQEKVNDWPETFVEYAAAHEVCHLKLEHYTLDVMDFITRGPEIELEADRCAFAVLGEEKFFTGFTHNFYETLDPERTVPETALRKSVLDVYGPKAN